MRTNVVIYSLDRPIILSRLWILRRRGIIYDPTGNLTSRCRLPTVMGTRHAEQVGSVCTPARRLFELPICLSDRAEPISFGFFCSHKRILGSRNTHFGVFSRARGKTDKWAGCGPGGYPIAPPGYPIGGKQLNKTHKNPKFYKKPGLQGARGKKKIN